MVPQQETNFYNKGGEKFPGVKEIAEKAVSMHKELLKDRKTQYFVSWDVMLARGGGRVVRGQLIITPPRPHRLHQLCRYARADARDLSKG